MNKEIIIKKDSHIRAGIKGVEILIEYDGSNNILSLDVSEESKYYADINLYKNNIIELLKKKYTEYKGIVKFLLTITKHNIQYLYSEIDRFMSFEDLVMHSVLQKELNRYITILVVGNVSDEDEYDELNECTLCPYFTQFNKLPKIKLLVDIYQQDISTIFKGWNETYFVTHIWNMTEDIIIPLTDFANKYVISNTNDLDITYYYDKNNNKQTKKQLIYLTLPSSQNKILLNRSLYYLTYNESLPKNTYYMYTKNNTGINACELISHNIKNIIQDKINEMQQKK